MVYGMEWRAWHYILYGLTGMAWSMKWPGGYGTLYGMTGRACHGLWYGLAGMQDIWYDVEDIVYGMVWCA